MRAARTGARRSPFCPAGRRPIRRRGSRRSGLRSISSPASAWRTFASETARLKAMGVTPWLVGDAERPTGRLVALIDPSGERSFLTDRGANEALEAADIPDALIAGAAMIHLSGYSFFAPSPRAAVLDVMRRAGAKPISVDPASAEFLREVGRREFSRLDAERGDPVSQCRGSRDSRRLGRPRDPVRASGGALSARRHQARRGGL